MPIDLERLNNFLWRAGSEHVGEVNNSIAAVVNLIKTSGYKLTDIKLTENNSSRYVITDPERARLEAEIKNLTGKLAASEARGNQLALELLHFKARKGQTVRASKVKRTAKLPSQFTEAEIATLLATLPSEDKLQSITPDMRLCLDQRSLNHLDRLLLRDQKLANAMPKEEFDRYIAPFERVRPNGQWHFPFRRIFLNIGPKMFNNIIINHHIDHDQVILTKGIVFAFRVGLLQKKLRNETFSMQTDLNL